VKLAQNQVWKQGEDFFRIVDLERLKVHYKHARTVLTGVGTHHHVSKKEFCRLIKGARLLTQEELRGIELGEASANRLQVGEITQAAPPVSE